MNHYKAFDFNGTTYKLDDPVIFIPDSESQISKPHVAIIKDITETKNRRIMWIAQWFYRPEDAETKNGKILQSNDARELFYSFHLGEVSAESIIHKCTVHFVPARKDIPNFRNYPGFIVRKVYDPMSKSLFKLTDKVYKDNLQHEINLLIQKTMRHFEDLSNVKNGDHPADAEGQLEVRKNSRTVSESHIILAESNALTGDCYRDKWLEKLLQEIGFVCSNNDETQSGDPTNTSKDNSPNIDPDVWPDGAVSAVIALEMATFKSFCSDQKYNWKMRQLCFNFKNNAKLTWRLINKELKPSDILTMLPNELKEGLTAEEIARNEPQKDGDVMVQMTDERCERCTEKKVRLLGIFAAGETYRYQLECTVCGKTWYASKDEA